LTTLLDATARLTLLFASFLVGTALGSSFSRQVTVSNINPRLDAKTGEILDIHDGNTIRIGDEFYWYGAFYGDCVEQKSSCSTYKSDHVALTLIIP